MSIISFSGVEKLYKVKKKQEGRFAGLRNFFSNEFKEIRAVSDISFDIAPGELVGYLGPNGAGKSTTIKMLTGILVPSAGKVDVAGLEPFKNRQVNALNIGVVFGQRSQLWWDLPVSDSYELNRRLFNIPKAVYEYNLEQARLELGISEFFHTPVRQLSLGQKMRAEIGAALLHDPKILFLDEPTIGLDVVAKDKIRKYIRRLNKEKGTTVILTTHDMTDVEEICDRIMIIDQGKKIYDGALGAIKDTYQKKRTLILDLAEDYRGQTLPDVTSLKVEEGRRVVVEFQRDVISAKTLIDHAFKTFEVRDLSLQETELEEIIREIYQANGAGRQGL